MLLYFQKGIITKKTENIYVPFKKMYNLFLKKTLKLLNTIISVLMDFFYFIFVQKEIEDVYIVDVINNFPKLFLFVIETHSIL